MNHKIITSGIVLLICCPHLLFSQTETSHKKKSLFSVYAAVLANKSFSHYSAVSERWGHAGGSRVNAVNDKYLPGALIGLNLELKPQNRLHLIGGLSSSITKADYLYSSSNYLSLTGSDYVSKTEYYKLRVNTTCLSLNFELGIKFRLLNRFSLAPAFILQKTILNHVKESGEKIYEEYSFYPESPLAPQNYAIREIETVNTTTNSSEGLHSAIRLTAFYALTLKERPAGISLFRNFGIKYKLPVWGIGFFVGI